VNDPIGAVCEASDPNPDRRSPPAGYFPVGSFDILVVPVGTDTTLFTDIRSPLTMELADVLVIVSPAEFTHVQNWPVAKSDGPFSVIDIFASDESFTFASVQAIFSPCLS
jgi:hypothetical protein